MENKITGKRVLVTGAAGFIGSNLVEDLLLHDNEVIGFDNLLTGSLSKLEDAQKHPRFTFVQGDIRNLNECKSVCDGVDYVLHQAALGSVPRSIKDPATTNDINVNGFLYMLIAARDARVKRMVYATSSSVYGDEERLPKVEQNIGKPLSPYAVSKAMNEQYAKVFSDLYGMELIGLRYFNVFGKQQDPDGAYAAAIPKFIQLLIDHNAPVIHGDGTQSRDFTYIDNVIHANHIAAVSTNAAALGEVFNIAYGVSTNLNELVHLLKTMLSDFDAEIGRVEVTYGPERVGDVRHSLASIAKAQTMLGYKPQHDIATGLRKAIHWYWQSLSR